MRACQLAPLIALLWGIPASAAGPAQPSTLNVPPNTRSLAGQAETGARPESPARVETSVSAKWSGSKSRQLGSGSVWREKVVGRPVGGRSAVVHADSSSAARVAASGGAAVPHLRSFVRPASGAAPVDPLEDPFGDNAGEAPAPTGSVPAPPPAAGPILTSPVLDMAPPPAEVNNPEAEAESIPPLSPSRAAPIPYTESTGHENFNGRDCGDELNDCQSARDFVKGASIRNISLDITPGVAMVQSENGGALDDQDGAAESPNAPQRTFHDRQGNVVATGRFTDFQYGRVWITDSSGQTTKVPFARLSDEDLCFITAWWSIPTECTLADSRYDGRYWEGTTLTWKASALCHKPLYFEEVQLERYGHSAAPVLQPVLSSAHFFLNIAALPYNMGIHPPNECRYPLGYYRPGNCAPWLVPPIPLSIRGGLLAAGTYLGGIYIIP